MKLEELTILRSFAAVTTVVAAALVAANWNARITVADFAIFIVASLAWMADGWLENKASLVIQNVIPPSDQRARGLALVSEGRERNKVVRGSDSFAKPVAPQKGFVDCHRRFSTFRDGNRY